MPRLKKEHLINWFKEGEKNREDWKIGTEHEKFVFHLNNLERVGYFGKSGVSELLNNLAKATKSLIANDLLDTEILFKANSFLKKDFIEILDLIVSIFIILSL